MVTLGQFQDGIHVGHLSIKMDWNDRCYWPSTATACHGSGIVDGALLLQILSKFYRIHVERLLINVHKFGQCARLRNRLGGGYEGVRDGDYYVAGFHAA